MEETDGMALAARKSREMVGRSAASTRAGRALAEAVRQVDRLEDPNR